MKEILKDFQQAVKRLGEVLLLPKDKIVRDSAIMRFQICFDLAWKSIKIYAKDQGIECYSPKGCLKEAFHLKVIGYEEKWLEMVDDRNKISHIYQETVAEEIYQKLNGYLDLFKELTIKLSE